MQTDFLQYIFQAINNLLTQNLGFFDTMGQNLFRSFATILIAWFGIKSALASASGRPSFQFDHFASLLLTISFGFAMVNYYSTPIPGVGTSFHNLVTNEAQFLSTQIDQAQLQTVVSQVADFESRMDSPSWGDILGTAIYVVVIDPACRGSGDRDCGYRLRFYCYCRLRARGARFHSVLYRPEDGVALLGLVSVLHSICVLPSHRRSGGLYHRKSHAWRLAPAACGNAFDRAIDRLVSCPVYYVSRVDLRPSENPFPDEPHLQWHCRRIFRWTARRARCRSQQGDVMDRDASFHDAKRLYLEQYGDPMVTNTYLKIALALLSVVCVALALIDLRTIRTFQNFRPLVIRIDDLGRAEAINYHNLEYKPQDAEAKYFLSQFCALYYRRNRYTIQDDFSKSLYFLDGKLADGILDAYRKDDVIKKFITNTAAPEIDVDVKKVALEQMQTPPFRARVDFYMVYYSPADHSELKRDLYTANFVFLFKSQVPNELIPINPLGITVTYFREDQAFK